MKLKLLTILILIIAIFFMLRYRSNIASSIINTPPKEKISNLIERNLSHSKNLKSYLLPTSDRLGYHMYIKPSACSVCVDEVLDEFAKNKLDEKLTVFAPNESINEYLELYRHKFKDNFNINIYKDSVSVHVDDVMLYNVKNDAISKIVGIKPVDISNISQIIDILEEK
ncbi:MAG TPA: hypothetical protein VJ915_05440 [Balneolaceae bacterium]|nr:hypothetical protein [Balneolaceae bacterium]